MNLRELRKRAGYTQKEIAKKLGVSQALLSHWEKAKRIPDINTAVKLADILEVSADTLLGIDAYANSHDLIMFDVIGTIKAGYDGECIEEPTGEQIPIPKQFLQGYRREDFMILRVSGESMYPKLLNGDLCVVRRQSTVDSGDTAVVLFNGNEATIKTVRYVKGEDWVELIPANPEYPTKRLEGEADLQSCRILGKVVKLIRDI